MDENQEMDAVEMADPVATGGDEDIFEIFKRFMGVDPIPSPIAGVEKTAMIIGTVMGRGIMGSVYDMPGDLDDVWVLYPISFREAVQTTAQGQVSAVSLQMGRVFNSMGYSKMSRMKLDYFTVLRNDSEKDRKIVAAYGETVLSHRAEDSDILRPASSILVGPQGR